MGKQKDVFPKELIDYFVLIAQKGESGREKNIGGGNTAVEITIMRSDFDLAAVPLIAEYVGGTARVVLNKLKAPIACTFKKRAHKR